MAFPNLSEVRRWENDRAQAFLVNDDMMRAGLDRYGRRYGLSSADAGQVVTTMTGARAKVLGWLQGSVAFEDVVTGRKFAISPKGTAILLSRARSAAP